jgi:hypothetical protein
MAKRPTDQQFETAIMWLQSNEGDNEEATACCAVADWIEHLRTEDLLRQGARQAGVTVARFRKRLAGKCATEPEMEN